MAGVMIGIDPHKGSHTAFALDAREQRLGQLRVRASGRQADGLLGWAAGWPTRTWPGSAGSAASFRLARRG